MMQSKVRTILATASDNTLSDLLVDSFIEVERNYLLKSWKTSELDAGHFVEAARRFLEFKLFGSYTPIGKNLSALHDPTMLKYLNASGNDSYRIHIPRILLSVYGIRNKRGVGHVSEVSPNHLDASFIIASVKWVLAELVRINSSLDADDTRMLIDQISERYVEGIWDNGEVKRILAEGLNLKEQILFLLLSETKSSETELIEIIEYSNRAYFKRTLKGLHKLRFIEFGNDGSCLISPKGIAAAEKIALRVS